MRNGERLSFSDKHVLVWTMIDWRSSAVRRFQSEQLPEDGKVGPKHVAIDVILMLF
jgi:hypothetical protein